MRTRESTPTLEERTPLDILYMSNDRFSNLFYNLQWYYEWCNIIIIWPVTDITFTVH